MYGEAIDLRIISIHAPRGGSDGQARNGDSNSDYFNPRSPWGERHPLDTAFCKALYFNPRSPWGERPGCWESSLVTF